MDSAENKCVQKGLEGNLRKQIEVVPAVNLGALQLHSLVLLQKATVVEERHTWLSHSGKVALAPLCRGRSSPIRTSRTRPIQSTLAQ